MTWAYRSSVCTWWASEHTQGIFSGAKWDALVEWLLTPTLPGWSMPFLDTVYSYSILVKIVHRDRLQKLQRNCLGKPERESGGGVVRECFFTVPCTATNSLRPRDTLYDTTVLFTSYNHWVNLHIQNLDKCLFRCHHKWWAWNAQQFFLVCRGCFAQLHTP